MTNISKCSALLLFLLLLSQPASAWDWDAHEWMASEVCASLDCGCEAEIVNGSTVPDRVFRDFINHHCYNLSWGCPEGDWECPAEDDCPALEKADEWLVFAESAEGCDRWYYRGIALHYYSDSFVFWHRVEGESYKYCHEPLETAVGEELKKEDSWLWRILGWFGIERSWQVCECGVCAEKAELEGIVRGFKELLPTS